jgi:DNA replication and repair protein RecF
LGEQLVKERLRLIERINQHLPTTYGSIAGKKTSVKITYESSIDLDNYSTNLLKKLESSINLDTQRGFTGAGPHRDDFIIQLEDKPAILSASRGEIRTLLLSLKIIELKLLEEEQGGRPLLLLDDVFSELDGARRRSLTDFLKDYQTIITTTDADVIVKHFAQKCTVIPIQ